MQQQFEFVRRHVVPPGSGHNGRSSGLIPTKRRKPRPRSGHQTTIKPLYGFPEQGGLLGPPCPPLAASSHRVVHVGEFMTALGAVIGPPERAETFHKLFGNAVPMAKAVVNSDQHQML
ncbi:MAG: hypothetical protein LBH06_04230 [Rikenellaceae bacterium]|jgi:hypothetical protein|nr:hypothetical protein [Rikenellaceae bacterium]